MGLLVPEIESEGEMSKKPPGLCGKDWQVARHLIRCWRSGWGKGPSTSLPGLKRAWVERRLSETDIETERSWSKRFDA
jgi:hypothetical protein